MTRRQHTAAVDLDDPGLQYRYMNGHCHALAIALHRITGIPMMAILCGRRPLSLDDVSHVVVGKKTVFRYLDIGGLRHINSILKCLNFHSDIYDFAISPVSEAEIWDLVRIGCLTRISEKDVAAALPVAQALLALHPVTGQPNRWVPGQAT